ncbi:ABC-2 type transport system permease protein [Streptomyces sp. BK022]|uniref:ABC transporter permease subunit n=1 Tax=Streptomyces sp. BK022 TaxID=2512123 RepID=UPI00102A0A71|nr:ABC transporter permease subunit [Streptomyces sp. BK022]RZU35884.1 ABC-2 type transport system permease protein [Streptomyces sp. BK022]
MPFVPVLHAEWIKIRTLRSLLGALSAVLLATVAFSSVTAARSDDSDPLYAVFFGVGLGQIAAVVFGALAVSGEYRGGALRLTLAAVPDRTRWFAAKAVAVALPVLAVGLLTGLLTLAVGRALRGESAPGWGEGLRGAVGCALYLTLMALLAAGLAAVLRSGVGTLGLLIPFLLIVSFVVGDLDSGAADLLPDRAGQLALHSTSKGPLGPWTGLAVTALWVAAALGAGAWCVRQRDA